MRMWCYNYLKGLSSLRCTALGSDLLLTFGSRTRHRNTLSSSPLTDLGGCSRTQSRKRRLIGFRGKHLVMIIFPVDVEFT
jgi:hypothetical protein